MTNTTPSKLVFEDDYIHGTDDFGTTPSDTIGLARATALTGTGASPSALIPATDAATELTDNHIPDIRDAFLDVLQNGAAPHNFLYLLSLTNSLDIAFPQLATLEDIPAGPEQYHEEGSALTHTLMVVEEYQRLNPNDVTGLLGAVAHDLGKARTPPDNHPHHYGHDKLGVEPARNLAEHCGLQDYETAMVQAAEQHMRMTDLPDMRHSKIIRLVDTVEKQDGLGIERLLTLIEADGLGRRPQTELDRHQFQTRIDSAIRAIDEIDKNTVREKHPGMAPKHMENQLLSDRTHTFREYLNKKGI